MQLQLRNEPLPKQQQSVAYRAARLAGLPHDCRGRRAMLEVLDVNLANAIDLKARSAQAGWQARTAGKKGGLSLRYGEFSEDLDAIADEIAHRIASLGGRPCGLIKDVLRSSRLPAYPTSALWDEDHLVAMEESIDGASIHVAVALHIADELKDALSSTILRRLHRRLATKRATLSAE